MLSGYLYFNAVLYLLLALWCILAPEKTSSAIGYQVLNSSGKSEYLVIYGGLQLGLAAFFAYCAWLPERQSAGLMFSLLLYIPIFTFRIISFFKYEGIGVVTIATAALECFLTLSAAYLYFKS